MTPHQEPSKQGPDLSPHPQVHGFVGFTHQRLPNGQIRLGWVRAPWRAAVRDAVIGPKVAASN